MVKDGSDLGYIKEIADFPFSTKEDGSCEHLLEDHLCAVYNSRPDICDVEKTWKKHHNKISKQEYFISTAEICNSFIIESKLDDKFLIDTKIIA